MTKLLVLLFVLAGCPRLPNIPHQSRDRLAQRASAVHLSIACGDKQAKASGVLLSDRHIATAAHAVECAEIPYVIADFYDGSHSIVRVVRDERMYGDGTDVAILESANYVNFELNVAPPELGDGFDTDAGFVWCATSFFSTWCGKAMPIWNQFYVQSYPGDSGAGVYDQAGRLVGIVVRGFNNVTQIEPSHQNWLRGIP